MGRSFSHKERMTILIPLLRMNVVPDRLSDRWCSFVDLLEPVLLWEFVIIIEDNNSGIFVIITNSHKIAVCRVTEGQNFPNDAKAFSEKIVLSRN